MSGEGPGPEARPYKGAVATKPASKSRLFSWLALAGGSPPLSRHPLCWPSWPGEKRSGEGPVSTISGPPWPAGKGGAGNTGQAVSAAESTGAGPWVGTASFSGPRGDRVLRGAQPLVLQAPSGTVAPLPAGPLLSCRGAGGRQRRRDGTVP